MTPTPSADASLWDRQEHARCNPDLYLMRIPANTPTTVVAILNGHEASRDDPKLFVARSTQLARWIVLGHNGRWYDTHDKAGAA